ncbi:primosomal protein N' [Naasia lichenicola]|uniref:Primosomal protein N n=1 Tax=Naasia lichenicola TaxID=2565933 RepID=A0A4S4FUR7_9MICO|nr:primosomal protein N' [Naasia lichenicola]THG33585.1 primosomal protein N' [Naasia lichenicola]
MLIDSPLPQLDHLFDYRVPDGLIGQVQAGMRVRVPLRVARRIADGFVVETAATTEVPGGLSELEALVSAQPVLTAEVFALARAVADRSAGNASDVLRLAIPKRYVREEKAWLARETVPDFTRPDSPELTGYGDDAAIQPGSRIALSALTGLVEIGGEWIGEWAITLAQLAVRELAAGRSAILAAPDYRDIDQIMIALAHTARPEDVIRLDARQPPALRYRGFLGALDPRPRILVGNRSIVYAPAHHLGLIALWNDGDSLYGEQLAPYAHARDVALLRQEQSGAALVLLDHARSIAAERLVELGWLRAVAPTRPRTPNMVLTPEDPGSPRIPRGAWRAATEAITHGPVLVQVARPGNAALDALRSKGDPIAPDAGRTAHDLGRAFPGVKVLISDGERPRDRVPRDPALVIATRGAEPIADGGYAAVLLLDGERMMMRESARVAEDCLRWWSAAATLAAPGAPVHLVGVTGPIAVAMATWRQAEFVARELADRRQLRFPPSVRIATVTGPLALVERATADAESAGASVLNTLPAEDGTVRSILRFDYGHGHAVAGTLKAAVIAAASRSRPRARDGGDRRPPPTLRVRMDDPDAL